MQYLAKGICFSVALLVGTSAIPLNAGAPAIANDEFATVYAFDGNQITKVAKLSNLVFINRITVAFDVHLPTGQRIKLQAVMQANGVWSVLDGDMEIAEVKPAGDAFWYETIFGGTGIVIPR